MNPELEERLRAYGAGLDEAARRHDQVRRTARPESAAAPDTPTLASQPRHRALIVVGAAAALVAVVLVGAVMLTLRDPSNPSPLGQPDATAAASSAAPSVSPPPETAPNQVPTTLAGPSSSAPAPACVDGYHENAEYSLELCDRGVAVLVMQERLAVLVDAGLRPDGYFGHRTREAVIAFQRSRGLTADGFVGPVTWRALELTPNGFDADGDGVIDPDEIGLMAPATVATPPASA